MYRLTERSQLRMARFQVGADLGHRPVDCRIRQRDDAGGGAVVPPPCRTFAIEFAMVCDFPVPRGPSITTLCPFIASIIALCCDESASCTNIGAMLSIWGSSISCSRAKWCDSADELPVPR